MDTAVKRGSALILGVVLGWQLAASERGVPAKTDAARTLRVVVLDPRGNPLADADVHASVWTEEKEFQANRDYETNATGVADVALPQTFYSLRLWAGKRPFVTMFANWEQDELARGQPFPAEYLSRLETGVRIGGRIVDEQGRWSIQRQSQISIAIAGWVIFEENFSGSPKVEAGAGAVIE
jgi:hypothetical protein